LGIKKTELEKKRRKKESDNEKEGGRFLNLKESVQEKNEHVLCAPGFTDGVHDFAEEGREQVKTSEKEREVN